MATETLESRVSHLEKMNEAIYNALLLQNLRNKAEFDEIKARLSALEAGLFDFKNTMERRLSAVEAAVAALPRILAETLEERDRKGEASAVHFRNVGWVEPSCEPQQLVAQ